MHPSKKRRTASRTRSGAIAGAASAFVFVVIHDIFISDIWFSLPIMLISGAACGASMGWAYGEMARTRTLQSWVMFNGAFVVMFFALGLASVLAFEPRTTLAALIEENAPPGGLIAAALPMTVAFTLAAAGAIAYGLGRGRASLGPALVTSILLVGLLGLNVSVIGLVDIPTDSVYLVAELFGLILALNVVFAAVFAVLEHRGIRTPSKSLVGHSRHRRA